MQLAKPEKIVSNTIALPGSKSESNRAYILKGLSENTINILNESDSDETQIIKQAIANAQPVIDCNHSGAAIRFLCAYFANKKNTRVILTGSQRLKKRTFKILVDAVKEV